MHMGYIKHGLYNTADLTALAAEKQIKFMGLLLGIDNWASLLTELIATQTWCNNCELN